jgi:hypothetical protein
MKKTYLDQLEKESKILRQSFEELIFAFAMCLGVFRIICFFGWKINPKYAPMFTESMPYTIDYSTYPPGIKYKGNQN